MDETYGTHVDDECFDTHDYDDDTDHDTDDDTDDGGRGNLYTIKAQGSRLKDQGSRIKAQGSRIEAQGSRLQAQGSRTKFKDQGPCLAMNEQPRRATYVILRQSKAPNELFNSR